MLGEPGEAQPMDIAKRLDAIVEHLLADRDTEFRDEIQSLYEDGLNPSDIPDPQYPDPVQYALAASIVERMCVIWANAPKNVLTTIPAWCDYVPALTEALVLAFDQECPMNESFLKRNIHVQENFMFFV